MSKRRFHYNPAYDFDHDGDLDDREFGAMIHDEEIEDAIDDCGIDADVSDFDSADDVYDSFDDFGGDDF